MKQYPSEAPKITFVFFAMSLVIYAVFCKFACLLSFFFYREGVDNLFSTTEVEYLLISLSPILVILTAVV